MKTRTLIILIGALTTGWLSAADAPEADFPIVGATYYITRVGAPTPNITLRIEKVLPSGWVYATDIRTDYSRDPADATKRIAAESIGKPAWYNLNTFSEARIRKDKN